MEEQKPIRSFLAIDLSPAVRDRIGGIQMRLRLTLKGVRWVRPEGIHLTLRFFGDIYGKDIRAIDGAVRERAGSAVPLRFRAGGLGAFPNPDRARVLWIGLEGDVEPLALLRQDLDRSLEIIGFPGERRPFKPHLTLGRARGDRILGVRESLRKGELYQAGDFEASSLVLFRSELAPGGAVYTKMAEFPFQTS